MTIEHVSEILVADGCLHLVLTSGGCDKYQFIYREAMSVYWNPQRKSFKCSMSIPGLPVEELLPHVVRIAQQFGVALEFSPPPKLTDLPDGATEVMSEQIKQLATGRS